MKTSSIADWTDEELCREIATQQCGGETRLQPEQWATAYQEYECRLNLKFDEASTFTRLYSRLAAPVEPS